MRKLSENPSWVALALIMLIGLFVRVYQFGAVPGGLNQDEASMGYDAWALLNFGIDRNGYSFPIYFVSWGSGQNALYSYIAMPFIALFGLSAFAIRLPAMLLGTFSIFLLFKLTKRAVGTSEALIAAAFLAIAPWHIMLSRWSLECNILPAFLLAAAYLFISADKGRADKDRAGKGRWRLYASAALFGVALYAYAPAYIVVPLFAAGLLLRGLYTKRISWVEAACYVAVLAVVALPLMLFLAVNFMGLPEFKIGLISIPKLTAHRGSMIGFEWGNIRAVGELLYRQNDGLYSNAIPEYGIVYLFSLPFTVIGVAWSFAQKKGRVMLLWLGSALCMAMLMTDININRVNSLFMPIVFFTALGISAAARFLWGHLAQVPVVRRVFAKIKVAPNIPLAKVNIPLAIIGAAYAVSFAMFCGAYFGEYNDAISRAFFRSFDRGSEYAASLTDGQITVVAPRVNMPYIQILFNQEIPPQEFLETVRYINPNAPFRWVGSFGRYSFVFAGDEYDIDRGTVYILDDWYNSVFLDAGFNIESFENYSVAWVD